MFWVNLFIKSTTTNNLSQIINNLTSTINSKQTSIDNLTTNLNTLTTTVTTLRAKQATDTNNIAILQTEKNQNANNTTTNDEIQILLIHTTY